jgi:hypothetical protein
VDRSPIGTRTQIQVTRITHNPPHRNRTPELERIPLSRVRKKKHGIATYPWRRHGKGDGVSHVAAVLHQLRRDPMKASLGREVAPSPFGLAGEAARRSRGVPSPIVLARFLSSEGVGGRLRLPPAARRCPSAERPPPSPLGLAGEAARRSRVVRRGAPSPIAGSSLDC